MFSKWLIKLGIFLTPFIILPGKDIRDVKMDVALIMAVSIFLSTIYEYGIKQVKNRWLMVLLWVACSSYFIAPRSELMFFGMDISLFWVWRPMFHILVFALMIFSISSIEISYGEITKILKYMSWVGFIMGAYVILQALKLDQLFQTCTDDTYGHMAGFIGNPTHVSPFVAMIVPICLYLKRYSMAVVMVISVVITTSSVAIFSLIMAILPYYMLSGKRNFFIGIFSVFAVICGLVFAATQGYNCELFADHLRFTTWYQILNDMTIPMMEGSKIIFPMTGMGAGTFKYVFHLLHNNSFHQAHNEYIEFLYNMGVVGAGLFFAVLIQFIFKNCDFNKTFRRILRDKYFNMRNALIASFICICVAACGTFIWQIGTTAFYTCLVVGLLCNPLLGGEL